MKKLHLIALLFWALVLTWCNQISEKTEYNSESRQTMISENCVSFFDGCNTCNRIEGSTDAACTRMFCETYEQPKCLDNEETNNDKETITYNSESRQTMIPATCKTFFDGCNTCNKTDDWENAACTMMFCETYEQPKCLD